MEHISSEWRGFLFALTGEMPPQADPDATLEVARLYRSSQAEVTVVSSALARVAPLATDALPGGVAAAFLHVVNIFSDDGGTLPQLADSLGNADRVMARNSMESEEGLREIMIAAATLSFELTILASLGPWSISVQVRAIARTRYQVRVVKASGVRGAALRSGGVGAGFESVREVSQDAFAQLLSMVYNPSDRRRTGLDGKKLGAAGLAGAIMGFGGGTLTKSLHSKFPVKNSKDRYLTEIVEVPAAAPLEGGAELVATGVVYKSWHTSPWPFVGGSVARLTNGVLQSTVITARALLPTRTTANHHPVSDAGGAQHRPVAGRENLSPALTRKATALLAPTNSSQWDERSLGLRLVAPTATVTPAAIGIAVLNSGGPDDVIEGPGAVVLDVEALLDSAAINPETTEQAEYAAYTDSAHQLIRLAEHTGRPETVNDWPSLTRHVLNIPEDQPLTPEHTLRLLQTTAQAHLDTRNQPLTLAELTAFAQQHTLPSYTSDEAISTYLSDLVGEVAVDPSMMDTYLNGLRALDEHRLLNYPEMSLREFMDRSASHAFDSSTDAPDGGRYFNVLYEGVLLHEGAGSSDTPHILPTTLAPHGEGEEDSFLHVRNQHPGPTDIPAEEIPSPEPELPAYAEPPPYLYSVPNEDELHILRTLFGTDVLDAPETSVLLRGLRAFQSRTEDATSVEHILRAAANQSLSAAHLLFLQSDIAARSEHVRRMQETESEDADADNDHPPIRYTLATDDQLLALTAESPPSGSTTHPVWRLQDLRSIDQDRLIFGPHQPLTRDFLDLVGQRRAAVISDMPNTTDEGAIPAATDEQLRDVALLLFGLEPVSHTYEERRIEHLREIDTGRLLYTPQASLTSDYVIRLWRGKEVADAARDGLRTAVAAERQYIPATDAELQAVLMALFGPNALDEPEAPRLLHGLRKFDNHRLEVNPDSPTTSGMLTANARTEGTDPRSLLHKLGDQLTQANLVQRHREAGSPGDSTSESDPTPTRFTPSTNDQLERILSDITDDAPTWVTLDNLRYADRNRLLHAPHEPMSSEYAIRVIARVAVANLGHSSESDQAPLSTPTDDELRAFALEFYGEAGRAPLPPATDDELRTIAVELYGESAVSASHAEVRLGELREIDDGRRLSSLDEAMNLDYVVRYFGNKEAASAEWRATYPLQVSAVSWNDSSDDGYSTPQSSESQEERPPQAEAPVDSGPDDFLEPDFDSMALLVRLFGPATVSHPDLDRAVRALDLLHQATAEDQPLITSATTIEELGELLSNPLAPSQEVLSASRSVWDTLLRIGGEIDSASDVGHDWSDGSRPQTPSEASWESPPTRPDLNADYDPGTGPPRRRHSAAAAQKAAAEKRAAWHLSHTLGSGITRDSRYSRLLDSMVTLLSVFDRDPLFPGRFSLQQATRQVIFHTAATDVPVQDANVYKLMALVGNTERAIVDVADLEALHLARDLKAYSDRFTVTTVDREGVESPGRNWGPLTAPLYLTHTKAYYVDGAEGRKSSYGRAPWGTRPYVAMSESENGLPWVLGHAVRPEVFARLIQWDPIRPPTSEIVLAIAAADGSQPRQILRHRVATAAQGVAWGAESSTDLMTVPPLSRHTDAVGLMLPVGNHMEEAPARWIPAAPGAESPLAAPPPLVQTANGQEMPASSIRGRPMLSSDGRTVVGLDLVLRRELRHTHVQRSDVDRPTQIAFIPSAYAAGAGTDPNLAYSMMGPSIPFSFPVTFTWGTCVGLDPLRGLSGRGLGQYLANDPDFIEARRLTPDGRLLISSSVGQETERGDPLLGDEWQDLADQIGIPVVGTHLGSLPPVLRDDTWVWPVFSDSKGEVSIRWPRLSLSRVAELTDQSGLSSFTPAAKHMQGSQISLFEQGMSPAQLRMQRWIMALYPLINSMPQDLALEQVGILIHGAAAVERMRLRDTEQPDETLDKGPLTTQILAGLVNGFKWKYDPHMTEAELRTPALERMLVEAAHVEHRPGWRPLTWTDFLYLPSESAADSEAEGRAPEFNSAGPETPASEHDGAGVPTLVPLATSSPGGVASAETMGVLGTTAVPEMSQREHVSWELLDAARRRDVRFASAPDTDVEKLVQLVLRGRTADADPAAARHELLDLVSEAAAFGRAGTIAALEAYHLQYRLGVLDRRDTVETPRGPVRVRNWARDQLTHLDLGVTGVLRSNGERRWERAPWGEATYPVLTDQRSVSERFRVVDRSDAAHFVSAQVLGELLAHDDWRPAASDVLAVASRTGSRVETVREVAASVGSTVFAPSGMVTLMKNEQEPGSPFLAVGFAQPERPGMPAGQWVPGAPSLGGQARLDEPLETVDGGTVMASAVLRHALVSADGRRTVGSASFTPADMVNRQQHYRGYEHVLHSTLLSSGSWAESGLRPEPNRAEGYNYAGHGGERGFRHVVVGDDGRLRVAELTSLATARGLRRRASFQEWERRGVGALNIDFCAPSSHLAASPPDPLLSDHPATELATALGRRVNAPSGQINVAPEDDSKGLPARLRVVMDGLPAGTPRTVSHWPMPGTDELDGLALRLGPLPSDESPEDVRRRVASWVRAIRHEPALGVKAEGPADWTEGSALRRDAPYLELLAGFAALERMRLRDDAFDHGPLSLPVWQRIVGRGGTDSTGLPLVTLLRAAQFDDAVNPEMTLTDFLTNASIPITEPDYGKEGEDRNAEFLTGDPGGPGLTVVTAAPELNGDMDDVDRELEKFLGYNSVRDAGHPERRKQWMRLKEIVANDPDYPRGHRPDLDSLTYRIVRHGSGQARRADMTRLLAHVGIADSRGRTSDVGDLEALHLELKGVYDPITLFEMVAADGSPVRTRNWNSRLSSRVWSPDWTARAHYDANGMVVPGLVQAWGGVPIPSYDGAIEAPWENPFMVAAGGTGEMPEVLGWTVRPGTLARLIQHDPDRTPGDIVLVVNGGVQPYGRFLGLSASLAAGRRTWSTAAQIEVVQHADAGTTPVLTMVARHGEESPIVNTRWIPSNSDEPFSPSTRLNYFRTAGRNSIGSNEIINFPVLDRVGKRVVGQSSVSLDWFDPNTGKLTTHDGVDALRYFVRYTLNPEKKYVFKYAEEAPYQPFIYYLNTHGNVTGPRPNLATGGSAKFADPAEWARYIESQPPFLYNRKIHPEGYVWVASCRSGNGQISSLGGGFYQEVSDRLSVKMVTTTEASMVPTPYTDGMAYTFGRFRDEMGVTPQVVIIHPRPTPSRLESWVSSSSMPAMDGVNENSLPSDFGRYEKQLTMPQRRLARWVMALRLTVGHDVDREWTDDLPPLLGGAIELERMRLEDGRASGSTVAPLTWSELNDILERWERERSDPGRPQGPLASRLPELLRKAAAVSVQGPKGLKLDEFLRLPM